MRRIAVRGILALDHAVFGMVARSRTPWLDGLLPSLSRAANRSVLWLAIAAGLGLRGGLRERRAALRGVGSIAATSAIVNNGVKRLARRPRPSLRQIPAVRRLPAVPTTTSFPSGHAASAFAFAVGASSELPAARVPLTAIACAVGYSRVYVGVHYPLDVALGAAAGAAFGYASRLVFPVLPTAASERPPSTAAVALDAVQRGAGVALVVNRSSGSAMDALGEVRELLPAARIIEIDSPGELESALGSAADSCGVLGICGGDGSIATAADVAAARGRPLLVVPGGTLNHLARDLRIESPGQVVAALEAGEGVRIDVGEIDGLKFVNTASFGAYAQMIDMRDGMQKHIGRWPAHFLAVLRALSKSRPMSITMNGRDRRVWMVYLGNGRHEPAGFAPSWRPRLDDGLLDVRIAHAEVRWSRVRLVASLLAGRLPRCAAYEQRCEPRLEIGSPSSGVRITRDGDTFDAAERFEVRKHRRVLRVYTPRSPG